MVNILPFATPAMDGGLNLLSIRNLPLNFISSGASARIETGSAIYTGPGFRTASDLGTAAAVYPLFEASVFPTLWAKSGTKVKYMTDPDSGNAYDTGVSVTSTEGGAFHEQGNGNIFYINQIDAAIRFAVAPITAAAATADVKIKVGTAYNTIFTVGTIYGKGTVITYSPTFTVNSTSDVFTATAHALSNNMTLQFSNSGGALPAGLSTATTYYIIGATANTFQVSLTSGGSAVDMSDTGSGTNYYINTSDGYLHGISGIPASGLATTDILVQSSNPTNTTVPFNGSFIFDLDSRMYFGGRTGYENILYWSAPEDQNNPQYFYDFNANGAGAHPFPGKLTGGIKGIGRSYIFANDQCFQTTGIDTPTGALLVTPITEEYGAYNPNCIVDMEGTVAFFGKKRLLPIKIQLAASGGSAPAIDQAFDNRLQTWLGMLDDDSSQGDAKVHYDKTTQTLKIQARRNGALETYCYDRTNNAFLPPEIRVAKSYASLNGTSYFGHVSNGIVYHDDYGLTNDGLAIYHAWSTGEIEDIEYRRRKIFKGRKYLQAYTLQYTGTMSKGCEHTVNVYVDSSTTASYSQSFDDSLITTSQGTSLGSMLIPGGGTFGGSNDAPKIYPFRNEIMLIDLSGDTFRIEWVTVKEGVYFKTSDFELKVFETANSQRTRN